MLITREMQVILKIALGSISHLLDKQKPKTLTILCWWPPYNVGGSRTQMYRATGAAESAIVWKTVHNDSTTEQTMNIHTTRNWERKKKMTISYDGCDMIARIYSVKKKKK